ncbi:hypothetical protein PR048_003396 [Dryococelus australis]|uniref:Uncharacterized protein n=1 Tax=Dryococelus australis TaxID=614101 RepID=A0ABQ9IMW5_9NEOP|nr:hypothetical protein PR048_003396 [Dryococelus australis]
MKPQPETYKRNVMKRARVKGLEYVNYKGTYVQATKTGTDCQCRQKCFQMVSGGSRMAILSTFLTPKDERGTNPNPRKTP